MRWCVDGVDPLALDEGGGDDLEEGCCGDLGDDGPLEEGEEGVACEEEEAPADEAGIGVDATEGGI